MLYRGNALFSLVAAAVLSLSVTASAIDFPTANGWNLYNQETGGDLRLQSPAAIRAFNSIAPELYANVMASSVAAQRQFASALPSIVDYSQTAHMVAQDQEVCGAYCGPDAKWVSWDTPFLTFETRRDNDGYMGYKTQMNGFATGLSRMFSDTAALGLAVGYNSRRLTSSTDYHWRNKSDTFHAALYGGAALGCFFFDAYAGYSRAWQRTERDTEWGGSFYSRNHGNYNDTVLSAGLKASYVWILPNEMRITPSIGLDYSYIRTGSFTETGAAPAGLWSMDKARHHSLRTPIMVSLNKSYSTYGFLSFGGKPSLWTPEVRAGYIPQFGAKRTGVSGINSYMTESFTANSSEIGGSYGTVGAGLKIKLRDRFIFAVDYDFTFGAKYTNHVISGTYGVSF